MIVQAKARLRFTSIPAKKMRLVGNTVKGLPVEQAINILNFTPRIAARHIAKTLKSAAANALSIQGTDHLRPEALRVKNIIVDEAPTAKRIRFQSMGRVFRYRKRFCHLTVVLIGETDAPAVRTAKPKAKAEQEVGTSGDETVKMTTKKEKSSGKSKSAAGAKKKSAAGKKAKKS